jgi:hypothetical protein
MKGFSHEWHALINIFVSGDSVAIKVSDDGQILSDIESDDEHILSDTERSLTWRSFITNVI